MPIKVVPVTVFPICCAFVVVFFLFFFKDVDECLGFTQCSHMCRNTFGGYGCYCRNGFYLSADGFTCFGNSVNLTTYALCTVLRL